MAKAIPESTPDQLERAVSDLVAKKGEWATLAVDTKVALLEELVTRAAAVADRWVSVAVAGKRLSLDSPWANEEWMSGPWAFIETCQALRTSLAHVARNERPRLPGVRALPDGRAAAQVFPANGWDALLLNGFTAEVWMQQGVTPENLHLHMAAFYFDPPHDGCVALVLGAGNITSIAPLDTVHRLYHMGQVVVLKLNPVSEWMAPILEEVFEPFLRRGYVRFAYGGAEVGRYLAEHEGVDELHMTGSERTYDAIVFGVGEDGRLRKERDEPLLDKPFTSELGGVGATLVLPGGDWSAADLRFQAEHILTQKLHNSGHNCVATQLLVLPQAWEHADALEQELHNVLRELPPRSPWYPGAAATQASIVARYDAHHVFENHDVPRTLLADIPPDKHHFAFEEEFFGAVLGITRLPGSTPEEFWRNAVEFANERLRGTLGINVIVHPKQRKAMGAAFDRGIADLRYGAIGINVWNGAAFLFPRCTWGAYPGHLRNDIQSGTGVVHNAFLFERAEKSVVTGPFSPMHRALAVGELHTTPKPPWFVTNKTGHITAQRIVRFAAAPGLLHLPGIFSAALRG